MNEEQSKRRFGNFTSSEIVALTKTDRSGNGFGAPALTYIEEKKIERLLNCGLSMQSNAFNFMWGHVCEQFAFENILGIEYRLCSTETLIHPAHSFWRGSPDAITRDGSLVNDIKCPATRKSFGQFMLCKDIDEVRANHPDGEKYFFQLTSNACITGAKFAEIIVFIPYAEDLPRIREIASTYEGAEYISRMSDGQLPHLPSKAVTNNLCFRWEVKEEDKLLLESKVIQAENLLNASGKLTPRKS